MSTNQAETIKPRFQRETALRIAGELCDVLRGSVVRMKIAGSLRRQRRTVGDIEILYIPKYGDLGAELFPSEVNLAERAIDAMLASGMIAKRPSVVGQFCWGEKNKLAIHCASGIPVDLFSVPSEVCPKIACPLCNGTGRYSPNWWVSLVIRTGSAAMNLELTSSAQRLGRRLNAYGSGVTLGDGRTIRAESEEDVFKLCGVGYLPPERRDPETKTLIDRPEWCGDAQ